jgi:hypothetical protein
MSKHFNYANVTATLALFFAMGGGALAAKPYVVNSTKQINPKVLKALRGKGGPIGPAGSAGAIGPQGKEGGVGKEGKEGKPGPVVLGAITEVFGPEVAVTKGKSGTSTATCPAGSRAISGGYEYFIGGTQAGPTEVTSEASFERKGWLTEVHNPSGNTEVMHVIAAAYCAKEKAAVEG